MIFASPHSFKLGRTFAVQGKLCLAFKTGANAKSRMCYVSRCTSLCGIAIAYIWQIIVVTPMAAPTETDLTPHSTLYSPPTNITFLLSRLSRPSIPPTERQIGERLADTMPELISFLATRPPVKHAVFYRTRGDYTPQSLLRDPAHLTNYGVSKYEGAIQENGFYLKHLSNSPLIRGIAIRGEELILGENKMHFWQMTGGHHVLGISPKQSNTDPFKSREFICSLSKYLIDELRCLGLNELAGFTVQFTDKATFFGTNARNETLKGTLVSNKNSVVTLQYTLASAPEDTYFVSYTYDENPNAEISLRFTKRLRRGGVEGKEIDYAIQNVEYGHDPSALKGYFSLDFRNKPQPLALLVLYTNNLRFIVNTDGSLSGLDGYRLPGDTPAKSGDAQTFLVILFASFIGFCLIAVKNKAKVEGLIINAQKERQV